MPWRRLIRAALAATLFGAVAVPAGASERVTLGRAVGEYLARSPDLASDRLLPTIAIIQVALAAERFRPQAALETLAGRRAYVGPGAAIGPVGSLDLPTGGTLRAGVTYTPGSSAGEGQAFGSMNIPLLRGAGSAIAQADLRIAGYQARAAEVALSLRTSNLAAQFAREFVLLDTLVRRRREADDALRRARDQLRTLRGLIERGILATGDALEIEAAVATRELEAIELTAEASRQSDLVLSLLGRDPRQTIETVLPDPLRWPVPTEEQLRATARTRPEVRLRQLRHSVAEENRLLAADNLRWDVSVIGDVRTVTGYDRNVFYPDQRFGSADLSYNIGVRVSVPLTTRSAELRLAQATTDVERARIEVRAATETAEREVLQLRSVLRRELDRRAATERLLAVSQEKLELERRRLELGRSGALQLRLAEEEFIRARAQVTADRARVLVAWIDILNASSSFQLPP